MVWALLAASEATTASKQPQRSKLSLQVKLVTPIYYMTKFQGIFVSQKMTLQEGDDKHGPLTRSAIAPLVKITQPSIAQTALATTYCHWLLSRPVGLDKNSSGDCTPSGKRGPLGSK